VEQHQNVLIHGPAGVGKTHLAQGLAHEACRRGFEVCFVSMAGLLEVCPANRKTYYDLRQGRLGLCERTIQRGAVRWQGSERSTTVPRWKGWTLLQFTFMHVVPLVDVVLALQPLF
jgi:hypothetical protein